MTAAHIKEIIEDSRKQCFYKQVYFNNEVFKDCTFENMDFENIIFSNCIFKNCIFKDCCFHDTVFLYIEFTDCKFDIDDSRDTSFTTCRLLRTSFSARSLTRWHFYGSDLGNIDFTVSKFHYPSFVYCSIEGVSGLPNIPMACPEEGSFIAYKIARLCRTPSNHKFWEESCIVKLRIPEDAKRSSGISRKCRCNKAQVLDIVSIDNGKHYDTAFSMFDSNFSYTIGETVEVEDFDENRWNTCAAGIHFFMSKQEAIDYKF